MNSPTASFTAALRDIAKVVRERCVKPGEELIATLERIAELAGRLEAAGYKIDPSTASVENCRGDAKARSAELSDAIPRDGKITPAKELERT